MNEQIKPSRELVNKVINLNGESLPKTMKSKNAWFKPSLKFALPALIILCVLGFQMFPFFSTTTNGGNWFAIAAHANDGTIRITKNMRVILPKGVVDIDIDEGASYEGLYFKIEGQNIQSVTFEGKDSAFVDLMAIFRAPDTEAKNAIFALSGVGMPLTIEEYIHEAQVHWDPTKYLILKMLEMRQTEEDSETFIYYRELWSLEDYSGDYMQFATDIVTVTVTFIDGEVMTQIIEMQIDDITGELSARIIG